MAETSSNSNGPAYPSCEEYARLPVPVKPWAGATYLRLFIRLQEPFSSAVSVCPPDRSTNGPREPYCRESPNGLVWHPIAEESVTDHRISSITVKIRCLDEWEGAWLQLFEEEDLHPGDEGTVWAPPGEGEEADDEETGMKLVRHVGEDRPRKYEGMVVGASNGQFVTVHDYATAVYEYLMPLRRDVLASLTVSKQNGEPLPDDTQLVLCGFGPSQSVETVEEAERRRREFAQRRARMAGAGGDAVFPPEGLNA
jgi:hypothetical protein